jgi:hypothetical protein
VVWVRNFVFLFDPKIAFFYVVFFGFFGLCGCLNPNFHFFIFHFLFFSKHFNAPR